MRKLKFHEKKLLKKVNFFDWKSTSNVREAKILRRYHIQRREDYHNYSKIVGRIQKMTDRLKKLPRANKTRIEFTQRVLALSFSLSSFTHLSLTSHLFS